MRIIRKRFDFILIDILTEQKMPLICLAPAHSVASEISQLTLNPSKQWNFLQLPRFQAKAASFALRISMRNLIRVTNGSTRKKQQLGKQISVTSRMMKL